ncbi:MAG: sensor domain-containing diguanylate cyclase [Planctomycetota bacterium]|jgi:diguanylate cyclase (GGDEF)-like protein
MKQEKEKPVEAEGINSVGLSLLERFTPLAQEINCLDIERIAKICIEDIPQVLGVRFASLYILEQSNRILHLQKSNHSYLINKIVSLNQQPASPMIMAVNSKELILTHDIDNFKKPVIQKANRSFSQNYQTNNCAIAPLLCQNNVVGVLNLADKIDDDFSKDDIALIELFSNLIGASIGNIKMFEKIQFQATRDGLTTLVNHKRFYEILERELWRNRRYGGCLSAIMADIDNLKQINDTHGHRAGDKVIREVSRRIIMCIRQIDIAARYGGDEFSVILPNTKLEDALVVAERIVEAVSNTPITWKGEEIEFSISVGIGQYGPENSPDDITSRSDKALYKAKKAGKNTVRVFESNPQ